MIGSLENWNGVPRRVCVRPSFAKRLPQPQQAWNIQISPRRKRAWAVRRSTDRIIGELERSAEARLRATKFCEALAATATGVEHPNLTKTQEGLGSPPIYRFRP